jgi:3D (Asp-Asp-Asp) domain-containing protein
MNQNPLETDQWEKRIVEATAYNEEKESCGKDSSHPEYGITASGTRVTENRTIAASHDLPFGTTVYIPSRSFYTNRGFYRVEDRGGAIKRGKIDIYIKSRKECYNWGRRKIEIYILKTRGKNNVEISKSSI